jgi:WhiB family redox-sensing transcriptional regulator
MSLGELCSGLSPDDVGELLGHEILKRPAWHRQAACRGHSTELFITSRGGSDGLAKALCANCSAKAPCLAAAVRDPDLVGIWGGTSESERNRLRRAVA